MWSGPEDVQVVELHDCFTPNEVVTYEGLGLCGEGEATRFIADGDNTYGGKFVVNPSGGLMSKGHPIGATGLAQAPSLYGICVVMLKLGRWREPGSHFNTILASPDPACHLVRSGLSLLRVLGGARWRVTNQLVIEFHACFGRAAFHISDRIVS